MIKPLTIAGEIYFSLLNLIGGALFLAIIGQLVFREPDPLPWGYLALFLIALGAGFISVRIPGLNSIISLADTFVFVAALFYGVAPAALLAGSDGFLSTRRHSDRLVSAFSSLSVMTISVLAAASVYRGLLYAIAGPVSKHPPFEQVLVPLGAMALVHFAINSVLVAGLTSFARRLPLLKTWREDYLWTSITFFSGALAAGAIYLFLERLGAAAFLVSLPIVVITYLTYRTYLGRVEEKNRRIEEMNKIHLSTVESLAMAIDAKGQTTYGHLRRVQSYAVGLAELVGVDDNTLEGIRAAALLHDVGKLAVPDYILNKPGTLTPAERNKLKTYPRIGAEILSHVRFPYPLVPLIRHHQERWDGQGYPDGLKGKEIPLGARIIGIADCADAMRCPRSYRPVASRSEVLAHLREQAGKHYDPALIELFCENLDALEQRAQTVEVPKMDGMDEIANTHREHAESLYREESSRSVLTDISATQIEQKALDGLATDLAASLGLEETLRRIMGRIKELLSFDAGAIYLVETKTGLIVPAFADGDDAVAMRGKSFRRGEGITGWVVDNIKPMINARPELDFYGSGVEIGRQYRSACVMPLTHSGDCLGTITLYHRGENHFGTEDERILQRIAPQVADAIRKARTYEESESRALTDALTGLPNSRALYDQLQQEICRARRGGRPLGVVVMDLDRFKPINDTYGHHVGDEVLREVSRLLKGQFRGGDTVCRWAGDEFVVLLPESEPELVESVVTRAQKAVEEMVFTTSSGRPVSVGLSAGWAIFPMDGEGFEELMRVADKRMYRNKSERHERGQPTTA